MPKPKQQIPKTLVADARAAVDICAGWNARLAARRITGFLNRRMQGSGLSLAQFGLMAQIASARDDTLGALAQRTGLDQSTLSRNLQVLETSGLIEIAAADRDARRRAVWLTEKGALSLEASLADCAAPTASSPRGSTPKPPGASRSPQRRWRRGSAKTSSRRFRPKADLQDRPAKGRDATLSGPSSQLRDAQAGKEKWGGSPFCAADATCDGDHSAGDKIC
jgi:DNA-binding MarR family transcriptional regulator